MNDFGEAIFKIPEPTIKMTNEWIDYAESRQNRTSYKFAVNNNNNNNFVANNNTSGNNMQLHHQQPQQFYNKMGIKQLNHNNNNGSALNQYSLMKQFVKPLRGEFLNV